VKKFFLEGLALLDPSDIICTSASKKLVEKKLIFDNLKQVLATTEKYW
jgi:hypothetical protein